MNNLITIFVMLVAAGCVTPAEKLRKSLVGSYELYFKEDTTKLVSLENGKVEIYFNGEKIVGKEVHVGSEKERAVFKVELNGDLTCIAHIGDGRKDFATKDFKSFKKLK